MPQGLKLRSDYRPDRPTNEPRTKRGGGAQFALFNSCTLKNIPRSRCLKQKPVLCCRPAWEKALQTPSRKRVAGPRLCGAKGLPGVLGWEFVNPSESPWTPQSWTTKTALQQPSYEDEIGLRAVLAQLADLPPLITSWEVLQLREQLAEAQVGRRFVLQGGDCAESFSDCNASAIAAKLKVLLQMSLVLVQGSKRPITRMARIAGQYAKPRSDDWEVRDGVRLPSYRGDIINRAGFTEQDRRPDAELLLRAYERSALTLNFLRSLVKSGFADLHHSESWDLTFAKHSPLEDEYRTMAENVRESVRFMENVLGIHAAEIERIDLFTCHEGLHLHYEQALTRHVPRREGWFNLSTHFPWIGLRTSDPGGAHVEYFRGIENPVGVKVGPSLTQEALNSLCHSLNPYAVPGKLALIHRMGVKQIEEHLPRLIRMLRDVGHSVVWICDPMHGNTYVTSNGYKSRSLGDIRHELDLACDIHEGEGSWLGGVHIELTGDDVTECTGGSGGLTEAGLDRAYRTEVDPRLNRDQALEIAMLLARKLSRSRNG
ncbi:MAG: 3-deoxy-7-phosphoheptulonate synthase [Candidatus Solibacter usitatus]|nr:3-deoxy-7-phosphoheptulonate synthase [Candidatus Solibacter usitatus]